VAPISKFCMTPIDTEGVVLGYGGISHRQITAGVAELAAVLEECDGTSRGGRKVAGAA
jgi:DNA-binding transcriptional MocR family regulator